MKAAVYERYGPPGKVVKGPLWRRPSSARDAGISTAREAQAMKRVFIAFAHLGEGFIALGSQDGDSNPGRPATWTSNDGMTWATVGDVGFEPMDGPMWLAEGPAGYMGIGRREDGASAWLGVNRTR